MKAGEFSKYTPVYEPVSIKEPTPAEKSIDTTLKAFMDVEMKLESDEEMLRRDSVLAEVRQIFIKWIQHVAIDVLHMPEDEAEDAGGELFISGSHRLGVRDIGADIDTVCVSPNFCTREHFFTSLKDAFQNHPDVTELNAVEGALVPIISFDFRAVSIDLLFARMAENSVPKDVDILDDKILTGLDDATEKSLNGPRVTNMIFKLVGEKTFPNFLIVLRCIRKWAKRRGLYGNKLGYLGGINCNILVAFICQLYPNSGPSSLLFRFFKQYKDWNWPEPIMLNNIQQHPIDTATNTIINVSVNEKREIWSPDLNPHLHIMPIITPAYPAMNSSYNVSRHTFMVMQQEFKRGYEVMGKILRERGKHWERLFEPSDFFLRYNHYLACHVIGTGENSESRAWVGFVESRIRRLIQYPFLETLPLMHPIQLYPVMSKTKKSEYSICYFIGFNLDLDILAQMPDKNIHIDDVVSRFQESLMDPERGFKGVRAEGLDFYAEHCTWKKLPQEVFDAFGGKEAAKAKRLELGFGGKKSGASAGEGNGATDENKDASKAVGEATETSVAKEEVKTVEVKVEGSTGSGVVSHPNAQPRKRVLPYDQYAEVVNKTVKLSEVPQLFPSQLRSGNSSGGSRGNVVPNVTWTLLENK